jgi:hypothetical protein
VRFILGVEELCETVELPLDDGAARGDPVRKSGQTIGVDAAHSHPSDLLGLNEPAALQDLEVLHDGSQRDVEGLGEVAGAGRTLAQALEYRPSRSVGQGPETAVHRIMLKHALDYHAVSGNSQAVT